MPAAAACATLLVEAAGESHALAAGDVVEIVRPGPCTRVPHAPPSLLGLARLRGAVLPVVSLAALLGRPAAPAQATGARVVVMHPSSSHRDARFGLLVDRVAAFASGDAGAGAPLDLAPVLARAFAGLARAPARGDLIVGASLQADPAEAAQTVALLGLRVAGQDYALRLDDVIAVAKLPPGLALLPRGEQAMLGVMARDAGVLPLLSLRALLGLAAAGQDRDTQRVVVVRLGGHHVGLLADGARAILRVPLAAIDPVPAVLTRGRGEAQVEAICRLDGGRRLVCLLAPARLLDSDTTARILAHATPGGAMVEPQAQAAATEQLVVFRIGDEHYGLPIAAVDEVVRCPASLTRVPRAPGFVEGVMNLRGRVVPVIDQRRRFAAAGHAPRGRLVLVVSLHGLQAGFAVDAVSEVLRVPAAALQPAPDLAAGDAGLFDRVAVTQGGRMILLVDPQALLDQAERDLLAAIAAPGAAA